MQPTLESMSSSYEKVRGGKLTFKGGLGLGPEKKISKKKKIKQPAKAEGDEENALVAAGDAIENDGAEPKVEQESDGKQQPIAEIDTGTGHAPDGKKSKKYEELFPVETRRFGYVVPTEESREAALNERVKKKADRYCK